MPRGNLSDNEDRDLRFSTGSAQVRPKTIFERVAEGTVDPRRYAINYIRTPVSN